MLVETRKVNTKQEKGFLSDFQKDFKTLAIAFRRYISWPPFADHLG